MRRYPAYFFLSASVACVAGCVLVTRTASDYPAYWDKPSPAMIGRCPNISGRYANLGEQRVEERVLTVAAYDTGGTLSFNCHGGKTGSGYWDCSAALAKNLTLSEDSPDASVIIEQPDENSIRVTVAHESQLSKPVVLSRERGDFSCRKDGVEFRHRGTAGPPALYAVAVVSAQVLTASNLRSFRRLEDNSLIMTVTEDFHDVVVLGGMVLGEVHTGYVRWATDSTSSTSTEALPAADRR